jgi:hypothetical protein
MKQVTPASDAPALSRWPMSCWAASTALKRTTPAEHQLLPDNWPTTGRPMLEMPHRQSDRQRVFRVFILARLPFVLGTVWSSPWLMPHTCRPSTRTESTSGSTVIMLTRLLWTKYLEQLEGTFRASNDSRFQQLDGAGSGLLRSRWCLITLAPVCPATLGIWELSGHSRLHWRGSIESIGP